MHLLKVQEELVLPYTRMEVTRMESGTNEAGFNPSSVIPAALQLRWVTLTLSQFPHL